MQALKCMIKTKNDLVKTYDYKSQKKWNHFVRQNVLNTMQLAFFCVVSFGIYIYKVYLKKTVTKKNAMELRVCRAGSNKRGKSW